MTALARPAIACTQINSLWLKDLRTPLQRYLWTDRWRRHYAIWLSGDDNRTLLENETALASAICGTPFQPMLYTLNNWSLPPSPVKGDYYVVAPGCISSPRWPPQRFAAVMDAVAQRHPECVPVLTGVAAEAELGDAVLAARKSDGPIVNLMGKNSLLQLIALIRDARFLLSCDTGTAHLAPLTKTRAFTLLANGQTGIYFPNPLYTNTIHIATSLPCGRCGWQCTDRIEGLPHCLHAITAEQVIEAILQNGWKN
jgi:ADP-heptose:LPS heptosyltransferase